MLIGVRQTQKRIYGSLCCKHGHTGIWYDRSIALSFEDLYQNIWNLSTSSWPGHSGKHTWQTKLNYLLLMQLAVGPNSTSIQCYIWILIVGGEMWSPYKIFMAAIVSHATKLVHNLINGVWNAINGFDVFIKCSHCMSQLPIDGEIVASCMMQHSLTKKKKCNSWL